VDQDHLGRKPGQGFYEWKKGVAIKPAPHRQSTGRHRGQAHIAPGK